MFSPDQIPVPTPRHAAVRRTVLACALLLLLGLVAGAAGDARADGGDIASLSARTTLPAPGAHGDLEIRFGLPTTERENLSGDGRTYVQPRSLVKELTFDLPPGYLADPTTLPTCTDSQIRTGDGCPNETQVGLLDLKTPADPGFPGTDVDGDPVPYLPELHAIFNMTRGPDDAARFGVSFATGTAVLNIRAGLRDDGDYGVRATLSNIPSGVSFFEATATFWGVPGDPVHDDDRVATQDDLNANPFPYGPADAAAGTPRCIPPLGGVYVTCTRKSLPEPHRPFMVAPTRCGAIGPVGLTLRTYDAPGVVSTATTPTGDLGGDCGSLPFAPALRATPDTRAAGQPAGLAVDLAVPQDDAAGRATAHVRDVAVTLPEGMALSPSAADGLGACSDAQLGIGTRTGPACPDASKIGTATIETPLTDAPLTGSLHLGTQLSGDPESGRMYRVFLIARGSGVTVRLRGGIRADRRTGQLTASFEGNPQVPFDALALRFDGGPRAPLVTPTACGTKTTRATITSWAGQAVTSDSSFVVDQGCPTGAFAPGFDAGTLSSLAGAYAPFTTAVARGDGDQELAGIALDLPSGLLGDLGSVPVCPEDRAAAGTCGPESRVGSTTVRAGSGPRPFPLTGTVSLGGPYRGAPFSLSIAVPAKAGPLDLGLVVVRSPLVVDAASARVSAPVDPLPTIVGGVPLKLRSVAVTLDRPRFTFNATDCTPKVVAATVTGTGGAVVRPQARYQADGCARLKLAPSLKLGLSGRADLRKGRNPKLAAALGQTFGQAAMRSVRVTLPLVSSLEPENAKALCTPAQDAAGACPAASIVGRATARTRTLHEPVSGPVYFVEGTRRTAEGRVVKTLPKLLLKLRGDGVGLDLRADTAVDGRGRLVTTFGAVPDVPITDFRLEIDGGRNGILTTTADPCRTDRTATVRFDGHNGARTERSLTVSADDCGLRTFVNADARRARVQAFNVGAGRVAVSGRGIVATRRTIRGSRTATLTAALTATARRQVAAGRTVRLRLTTTFTPRAGRTLREVRTVTVPGARRASRSR